MGMLSRAVAEQKSFNTLDLFREVYGGRQASTGHTVNAETALCVSTVFACARVVGLGLAQVPLKIMRDEGDGKKKKPARDHHLYKLLARKPNFRQTSFEFREMMGWHLVLQGSFYAFKNIVFGKLKELIPFGYGAVREEIQDDGTTVYWVTGRSGVPKPFPASVVWHVRGPSLDGFTGMNLISKAREAIGLAIATEEQHSRMHKNGVRTSGVYSVEGSLNDAQHKALRDWLDREYAGLESAGKPIILDRSAKWLSTSMNGVDSQHLETRRFQIEEICRFFGVMPIMIGYSDKASTYASAEQMFLAHVVHTLAPWYKRIEDSIDVHLLTDKEFEQGFYANFVEEGLLRGDSETTANVLDKYVNGGLITPNEGRAKLDMNPDPDPASDKLRVPANIVGKTPAPAPEKIGA
jgi:HK97 family phage portal protein